MLPLLDEHSLFSTQGVKYTLLITPLSTPQGHYTPSMAPSSLFISSFVLRDILGPGQDSESSNPWSCLLCARRGCLPSLHRLP